jgi:hypothetical protein
MQRTTLLGAAAFAALLAMAGCVTINPPPPEPDPAAQQQDGQTSAKPRERSGQAPEQAAVPQPVIGAEGEPQPDWVRNPGKMETADMMYFTGEGREGKNVTMRKNGAFADAGRQVGSWKESVIASTLKDYADEAGETGNTQSLEQLKIACVQNSTANTSGILQRESWIAPDNTYVMLVSYPKGDLKKDFKASLNSFVRNEGAKYTEIKANEAFKLLEQKLEPPKE